MRRFMLMEVCEADTWSDVDGNTVYFPVDGGRGELMWLRTDRVIECANSGPCYRVPRKGDMVINADGMVMKAIVDDWGEHEEEHLCFPVPAQEETKAKPMRHRMVETPNGNVYHCKDCSEVNRQRSHNLLYKCGAMDSYVGIGIGIPPLCPLAVTIEEPVDPAEYMGGAMVGVL